ncbi:hypothetical protein FHS39_003204 [Streptomyces olivoverticillatus]|uniref:Secreted protein n=1 Tax=Streptomyces olivoverticillatus TaxID=66427 RepID=A0A7W7PMV1_9ACTN|nr:hypothetical protein [Streptomyces olivoverticillatus]MBB4894170.1 hypothetical protein [Streptomyces olivoverticillatus]
MASTRTAARVLAAVAALPMMALLFTGVAQADDGGQLANRGSNAAAAGIVGSGIGGTNRGTSTSTTTQQQATGTGAANQSNTASVNRSGHTAIRQDNITVRFTNLW